jgi:hypothetical protein
MTINRWSKIRDFLSQDQWRRLQTREPMDPNLLLAERRTRHSLQVRVVRQKNNLCDFTKLAKQTEGRCRTIVIKLDQDVVQNYRKRRLAMLLPFHEPITNHGHFQSHKKLVTRALAQFI